MVAAATVPGVLRTGTHASRPAATAVGVGTLYACSTHGLIYQSDGATWSTWNTGPTPGASVIIDGGGATITTGDKGFIEIPFAATIIAARIVADVSGSMVVDIEKATYSGLFSTSSICASAKPTLSSARKNEDTTLTGWTTSVAAGDWLLFQVDSCSGISRATVALTMQKV